ncbi:hypothetical protein [Flavobacterium sp.]|uniref:hypothetical protein n=1 Tax=Flavobacterium sp. TaxID=239 RepID=UPI00403486D2
MSCTKCKKKTALSGATEPEKLQIETVAELVSGYRLRDGISYDQIGLNSPSDAQIEAFLKVNPNRKSLFAVLPDNMKIGMSKG